MNRLWKAYVYLNVLYYLFFWTFGFKNFQQNVLSAEAVHAFRYIQVFYEYALIDSFLLILILAASMLDRFSYKSVSLLYLAWVISESTQIITRPFGDPDAQAWSEIGAKFLTLKFGLEVIMFASLFYVWKSKEEAITSFRKYVASGLLLVLYVYEAKTGWKQLFTQLFNPDHANELRSKFPFVFINYNLKLTVATLLSVLVGWFIVQCGKRPNE